MNIRYIIVLLVVVIFTICAFGKSGAETAASADTAAKASLADTAAEKSASALPADTAYTLADTTVNASSGDMPASAADDMLPDAAWLDEDEVLDLDLEFAGATEDSANAQQKLDVIRRNHAYTRQVRLAIWMMILLAVAMATAQSWNPN